MIWNIKVWQTCKKKKKTGRGPTLFHTTVCEKCKLSPCNLSHMFALCPKLQNFWNSFFKIVSDVLKIKLDICPLIAIFGVPSQCQPLNHKQGSAVTFASLLARSRILLSWTSPQPPSISVWLKDLIFFLKLEKVKYNIRGRRECFFEKWQQCITYFNDIQILEVDWGEV